MLAAACGRTGLEGTGPWWLRRGRPTDPTRYRDHFTTVSLHLVRWTRRIAIAARCADDSTHTHLLGRGVKLPSQTGFHQLTRHIVADQAG